MCSLIMTDVEEDAGSKYDDIDLDALLARVERKGPLTFTKKRCLYKAPEFVKRLSVAETVDEGSTVKFSCSVAAFPKPTLSLFKDGDPLANNNRVKLEPGEQAKSKSPKKSKSHKYRTSFSPIRERKEEEEMEAEKAKGQPESPLTYLYLGNKWNNRTWPEFLGSWAFVSEDFDYLEGGQFDTEEDDVFLCDETAPKHHVTPSNGYDENDDEEDDDYDNDIECTSSPESDGYYTNDLPESLGGGLPIPNLVFENKNLVRSKGLENLSCFATDRPLKLTRDENANKKIVSLQKPACSNGSTDAIKHSSDQGCNGCAGHGDAMCCKRLADGDPCLTATGSLVASTSAAEKQTPKHHGKLADSNGEQCGDSNLLELLLILSSSTFSALSLGLFPSTFTLFVLFCILIYSFLKSLLISE